MEIDLSSFSARGASPVSCDAELDSPASIAVQDQDFPDAPVVQEACGQDSPVVRDAHDRKRRRHVAVQDYPWKFVSPQLLDRNGARMPAPANPSSGEDGTCLTDLSHQDPMNGMSLKDLQAYLHA